MIEVQKQIDLDLELDIYKKLLEDNILVFWYRNHRFW